jgi:hypothetical protein
METSTLMFGAIVLAIWLAYKYLTRNNEIFEKRGVSYDAPSLFLGNISLFNQGFIDMLDKMYTKYKSQK